MDEITQFINEDSVRGDIARELAGIVSDYQAGTINSDDKEQLVNACIQTYEQNGVAENEVMWRWAISAATIAVSVV